MSKLSLLKDRLEADLANLAKQIETEAKPAAPVAPAPVAVAPAKPAPVAPVVVPAAAPRLDPLRAHADYSKTCAAALVAKAMTAATKK